MFKQAVKETVKAFEPLMEGKSLVVSEHSNAWFLLHRRTFDFPSGLKRCWKEEHLHPPLQTKWITNLK